MVSKGIAFGGVWGRAPALLIFLLFFTTQAQAQSLLERTISRATGGTVALTGLSDAFGSTPHAERLQLKDDDGVWLEAQDVSLEWTRRALFSRELRIDNITAARATITRLPKSSGPSTGPPELPLRLTVAQLNIARLVVAAPVAGAAAALHVEGNGAWDGAQVIPKQWLLDATTVQTPILAPNAGGRRLGYGYQVWLLPGEHREFALRGIFGQAIIIDPASHTVLVQTAVLPKATNNNISSAELTALWNALVAHNAN